ncbi:lipocalin family protein [Moheibacter sediminis]|uniref:Apolipoprotein D and lipocalin family protein n=1 Tax=Moheibacter sediminis TaxID=1434700 RepID=A0A1W1Z9E8_9FLAO|nr:lipocalin family protein [Moheibacter sediminis]SMC45047.1 apolipoprotein D and lipocalin family protein [Moheibacter sediminis]
MKIKLIIAVAVFAGAGYLTYKILKPIKPSQDIVQNFNVKKYAGKWYEIARLDFKWEKGLSKVTAEYTLNEDGSIKVDNKGFHAEDNEWRQSIGKAKFVNEANEGALKVSFFGPFYSGYNVVKIDDEYKYVLVFGESLDNMWILSREKTIPEEIKDLYTLIAAKSGYKINELVWTAQD